MPSYFLGLDSSTQSLGSILIDLDTGDILDDRSILFDEALPEYGTTHGVLRRGDSNEAHSPPLMWADALDLLFQRLKKDKLPLGEILAVSGSGQQHGSVYITGNAEKQFRDMAVNGSLADNVSRVLSRPESPVWLDSSTTEECGEIREALGGGKTASALTGSDITERFTGPQIRKFYKQQPGAYRQTGHIAVVSSFMSSLMAGQVSPVDGGDGAGFNLMDIASFTWHPKALEATAPNLREKLPPIAPSHTVLGAVNPYLVLKYNLNPAAKAVVWSGDNPCSLIGTGLVAPGLQAVSLGTSDTVFGAMAECRTDPRGEGHVFGSPAGGYMSMICFKNGSLARENARDARGMSWMDFSRALRDTPPGNRGGMMLPWFEAETVPRVLHPGVHRRDLPKDDAAAEVRAVVEAQMMSMRLHSEWTGTNPPVLYATGGASANPEILQVMSDVHNTPVVRQETPNSAALGAALRAAHAWTLDTHGAADWEHIVAPFTQPVASSRVTPDPEAAKVYDEHIRRYAAFEAEALRSN